MLLSLPTPLHMLTEMTAALTLVAPSPPPSARCFKPLPPHPFTPAGVLTETTAELAAALTLAAARRVPEADVFMRAGHYKGWLPTLFVGQLLQVCSSSLVLRQSVNTPAFAMCICS